MEQTGQIEFALGQAVMGSRVNYLRELVEEALL
jgi:hypothetical protein